MKRTKNTALFLLIATFIAALSSCNPEHWQVKMAIKQYAKNLPTNIGDGLTMTDMQLEGDYVVVTVECDEDIYSLSLLRLNKKEALRAILDEMASGDDEDVEAMRQAAVDEGIGFHYDYVGDRSGEVVRLTLTSDMLANPNSVATQAFIDTLPDEEVGDDDIAEALLKEVSRGNEDLPMQVDYATTMTNMAVEGDYVVYTYTCDEEYISMDLLRENKAEVKQQTLEGLQDGGDTELATFLNMCRAAGKSLRYRYIGSSTGKECVIDIPIQEIGE